MAKVHKPGERPRKTSESDEAKAAKKAKEDKIEKKIDIDEDDPLAEIKSLQKEEIATEAIPVSELKKAKYEKQVPGEFDFEAFDTKGFGEGYSKDKRAEMENVLRHRYIC
jgi:small subunit ribosomal protein S1